MAGGGAAAVGGPSQDDVLVARGLTRIYRDRRVIDDVDLGVRAGEVVGLLGRNGAGKTTCFRIIAGLEIPDEGQVMLNGRDLGRSPLWRRVRAGLGYLAQEPTVFRRLSVRANLALAVRASGGEQASVEGTLRHAGLDHLADQPAGRLSGGERRRLEIARALATGPRALLLDEPFAGVDPVAVRELQSVILDLAAEGLAVLVTDHAVRETLGICDRAVILDSGRVMASGAPQDVSADPLVRARYLGPDFRWESRRR